MISKLGVETAGKKRKKSEKKSEKRKESERK